MALAIGAFERKLVTPDKWDQFLGENEVALSEEEKAGYWVMTGKLIQPRRH